MADIIYLKGDLVSKSFMVQTAVFVMEFPGAKSTTKRSSFTAFKLFMLVQ